MYPTYSEVSEESNNWENKEALWKHRWYAGTDGHGSSNGNYKLNRNDEYLLCDINKFDTRFLRLLPLLLLMAVSIRIRDIK